MKVPRPPCRSRGSSCSRAASLLLSPSMFGSCWSPMPSPPPLSSPGPSRLSLAIASPSTAHRASACGSIIVVSPLAVPAEQQACRPCRRSRACRSRRASARGRSSGLARGCPLPFLFSTLAALDAPRAAQHFLDLGDLHLALATTSRACGSRPPSSASLRPSAAWPRATSSCAAPPRRPACPSASRCSCRRCSACSCFSRSSFSSSRLLRCSWRSVSSSFGFSCCFFWRRRSSSFSSSIFLSRASSCFFCMLPHRLARAIERALELRARVLLVLASRLSRFSAWSASFCSSALAASRSSFLIASASFCRRLALGEHLLRRA